VSERLPLTEFQPWPKIPRLHRQITVTEKIDGTNAAVVVRPLPFEWDLPGVLRDHETMTVVGGEPFAVAAQSRNRWCVPTDDNAGFARWVFDNANGLARTLGAGRWFGEWWGQGIQRGYGMDRKVFSLFNPFTTFTGLDIPEGLDVVPLMATAPTFDSSVIEDAIDWLARGGSFAAPGFMKPEGVIVRHSASGQSFKRTIEKDGEPKGAGS
jgi:hypothetical protein